jgi:hypothetical protein
MADRNASTIDALPFHRNNATRQNLAVGSSSGPDQRREMSAVTNPQIKNRYTG